MMNLEASESTMTRQSRAMNAAAAQFRKMLNAHLRRAASERRDIDKIRSSRLGLLERILTAYR